MRLNFSKNIRMVRSEYGINMNAWIHPADHFHPFMTINKNVLHCSSPHCKVHHEILIKVWLKMQVFRFMSGPCVCFLPLLQTAPSSLIPRTAKPVQTDSSVLLL